MILSLEWAGCQYGSTQSVGVLLSEVATEEEAFGEMRRFLQVNNIPSDTTYVKIIEEHKDFSRIIPRHKRVKMYSSRYDSGLEAGRVKDVAFGIYYGTGRPRYEQLGTLEYWGLQEKEDWQTGQLQLRYEKRSLGDNSGEWYNCVKRYFNDLATRKAGGD